MPKRQISKVDCVLGPGNGVFYNNNNGKRTYLTSSQQKWPYIERKCSSGSSAKLNKVSDPSVVASQAAWTDFLNSNKAEVDKKKDRKFAKRQNYKKYTEADLVINPAANFAGLFKPVGSKGAIGGYVMQDGKYKWRIVAKSVAGAEFKNAPSFRRMPGDFEGKHTQKKSETPDYQDPNLFDWVDPTSSADLKDSRGNYFPYQEDQNNNKVPRKRARPKKARPKAPAQPWPPIEGPYGTIIADPFATRDADPFATREINL